MEHSRIPRSERDTFHRLEVDPLTIPATLPPVPAYLFATAGHLLKPPVARNPRLNLTPTEGEMVLGPLLGFDHLTRARLTAYLAEALERSSTEIKKHHFIPHGVSRLRRYFETSLLGVDETSDALHLNPESIGDLDVSDVQRIVRIAAHRWILNTHAPQFERFTAELQRTCRLTSREVQMLNELTRRFGERYYINATTQQEKNERRVALFSLAQKLKTTFGEDMIQAEPQDLFAALKPLLHLLYDTAAVPLPEDLVTDHVWKFDDYLPVAQLLLERRFAADRLPEAQRHGYHLAGRRRALAFSLNHLEASRRVEGLRDDSEIPTLVKKIQWELQEVNRVLNDMQPAAPNDHRKGTPFTADRPRPPSAPIVVRRGNFSSLST